MEQRLILSKEAMETAASKARPMSKDEVHLLLDLIQENEVILSKETNAQKNKEKDESWALVCEHFIASTGVLRTVGQLKAKWDNLKKAARKRSQLIGVNKFEMGGEKPDYIPPDETLEKVASLLSSTCNTFKRCSFGGDGVEDSFDVPIVKIDTENTVSENIHIPAKRKLNETGVHTNITPEKGKKKKFSDEGRLARNLAIARYYDKRTEKLELEIQLLKNKMYKDNDL